ncbi:hypothetical protein KR018_000740, partial [Drosophila ironensis]
DTGTFDKITSTGTVSAERSVPEAIQKPAYYFENLPSGETLGTPEIKDAGQIERMRQSGKLAAQVLRDCGKLALVGKTTDEIDAYAHERILAANAYPSPLRYSGFPKSICTSINNVACHGIPNDRPLANGDIINIDVTVYLNGFHGDCSKTFLVGDVDERGRFLVEATEKCLDQSIALCGPNVEFNAIGKFIESYCEAQGLESVANFIGHGIGSFFHGPPEIYHYYNEVPGTMLPGMTFTIEPILSLGAPDVEILDDGWTALSLDGSRSAQCEHTVLVTETGTEILTKP